MSISGELSAVESGSSSSGDVTLGCTLNALMSLTTELQIVGELRPGDRLTVPSSEASSSSLGSLPTIERDGVWQSLVRSLRGQSRADTVAYVASLIVRVHEQSAIDTLSSSDLDSLVFAIGCARTGISSLRSTYIDDTRVSTLLLAHSLALNSVLESLVQRKAAI